MARPVRILSCAAAVMALVLGSPGRAGEPAGFAAPLTVVELFTSQGCSSCPPADAFLGELAGRVAILALSQHVDYWDYIGWKDTFARHAATERQQAYAKRLGGRYVYTPQMVVGGRAEAVGSDRGSVERLVAEPRVAAPRISVHPEGNHRVRLVLSAGAADSPATIWLVGFDPRRDVVIDRGENGGRTLAYHNVVREFRKVGTWHGQELAVILDRASMRHEGGAVIVQSDGTGPILTAIRISPMP